MMTLNAALDAASEQQERSLPRPGSSTPSRSSVTRRSEKLRTAALAVIAFILVTQALYVAASVLLPAIAAIVLALAMRPVVRHFASFGVPQPLGALLTVGAAVGITVFLGYQLVDPASNWIGRTPIRFKLLQLERRLEPLTEPIQDIQTASEEITRTIDKQTTGEPEEQPQSVVIKPRSLISEFLSSSWQIAAGGFLCIVLTYFYLARGEILVARLATVISERRQLAVQQIQDPITAVERCVSKYLLTVSVINICLGILVGLACWLIGLPNPLLWGVMATMLNFLPYIGGLIGSVIVLLVSLFTFESISYSLIAPVTYLMFTALEGNFITPAILGRSMRLNPLVVVLALTYWTWLWGVGGAILAVPLLAIAVAACRQFTPTQSIAAILSD